LNKADTKTSATNGGSFALPLNRYFWYFGLAIVGCAADLLSKYWVFHWRGMPRQNNEWWIIEGYFGIETAMNPGALFGMGGGKGWLFASLSIVAAIAIPIWLFYKKAALDLLLTIALGCVTGGIFGNLYDRLGLWTAPGHPDQWHSEVRDWILFRLSGDGPLRDGMIRLLGSDTWPNFNIADVLLVCGACMLLYRAFFTSPLVKAAEEAAKEKKKKEATT